jgi:hypothetical protein
MRGIAKNNQDNLKYLKECPAVQEMTEAGELIDFKFDPAKQPTEGVPSGVFFDLAEPAF